MTFTFRGTVKSPTGTVQTGTARVTALSPVKDTTGDVVFTGTSPQALVTGPPSFSFSLPDSSVASAYQLDVVDSNGAAVPFLSPVVFAAGAPSTTLDLSDVVGTTPVVGVPTTYTAVINYSGSGFPEGVVTASVGARYVDTAATSGAVEWVKASGTGNTGWRVVSGDTGWRKITPANADFPTGWYYIRRVGDVVHCASEDLNTAASPSDPATLPGLTGFRMVISPLNLRFLYTQGGSIPNKLGVVGFTLTFYGVTGSSSVQFNTTWTTTEAWPSTLPGT